MPLADRRVILVNWPPEGRLPFLENSARKILVHTLWLSDEFQEFKPSKIEHSSYGCRVRSSRLFSHQWV